jgi:starch-binding outer membrane protein, SusD/RagB family
LLARVYLYNKEYSNADLEATKVISQSSLFSLPSLNDAFLKNSNEAIWQLQPVKANQNTQDAFVFILPASGPTTSTSNPVYLSTQLVNSFENNDARKTAWVNSVTANGVTYYYPYKYKATLASGSVTEYLMMFRLAEQYLIRAEARARLNNISGARADLNAVRTRAGLDATTANDEVSLVTAILNERRVELFTELGQRWFDLKRTNTVDNVMNNYAPAKGTTWNPNWQLYPIPFDDIQKNSALVQNPGY